jgi:hypothetical protein
MVLELCRKCGGVTFFVIESIVHECRLDSLGILHSDKNKWEEIDTILCRGCNTEYSEIDFKSVKL